MQVINDSGTQVVDTWAFNAENLSVSLLISIRNKVIMLSLRMTHQVTILFTGADEYGTHESGHHAPYTARWR